MCYSNLKNEISEQDAHAKVEAWSSQRQFAYDTAIVNASGAVELAAFALPSHTMHAESIALSQYINDVLLSELRTFAQERTHAVNENSQSTDEGQNDDSRQIDVFINTPGFARSDIQILYDNNSEPSVSLQYSDVFRMLTVGMSPRDHLPGSPVVSFYVRTQDIATIISVVE